MRFTASQRADQAAHFDRACPGVARWPNANWRLLAKAPEANLNPLIAPLADPYFKRHGISWHRHSNHGLSSQSCCLNFLMPLATRRDVLARVIGTAMGIEPPEMLEVESGPGGEPWFIGFEWIGEQNYLDEWPASGAPTRGANVTSADAFVRFRHAGRTEALLIEWKYTESYGAPIPNKQRPDGSYPNDTRAARYADKLFAPAGPIRRADGLALEHFFWEPFYQLMRQQMLAHAMEAAREGGAERVRVLHISPADNRALHRVTSPHLKRLGRDAFDVFARLLEPHPDGAPRFIARTTEQVFGAALTETPDDVWAAYLIDRYRFLTPAAARSAESRVR